VACERALSLPERSERRASSRLRRLVPPALLEGKSVAAIRVEDTARREALLYARTSSGWRCLSRYGVPADEARLSSYVEQILEAQGILQSQDPGRANRFGLDPPSLLRVSLHGARLLHDRGHDLIALAEIGAAVPGGRGTYARSGVTNEVIAVDVDLRTDLAWPKALGLAPLLDPRIVPAVWSGSASVERIAVRPQSGAAFELRKRPRTPKPEEFLRGGLPWDWVLVAGGREQSTPQGPSNAYASFLQSATYNLALDPRLADGLGLARPRARVVLYPPEGKAVEIQIGGPAPAGGIVVKNALTQGVFAVDSQVAALLVPRAEALRHAAKVTPWDSRLPGPTAGPDPAP
jgi:hypothetical protein